MAERAFRGTRPPPLGAPPLPVGSRARPSLRSPGFAGHWRPLGSPPLGTGASGCKRNSPGGRGKRQTIREGAHNRGQGSKNKKNKALRPSSWLPRAPRADDKSHTCGARAPRSGGAPGEKEGGGGASRGAHARSPHPSMARRLGERRAGQGGHSPLRLHVRDLPLELRDLGALSVHLALVLGLLAAQLLVGGGGAAVVPAAEAAEAEWRREEHWHAVPEAERRVAAPDDDVGGAARGRPGGRAPGWRAPRGAAGAAHASAAPAHAAPGARRLGALQGR
mmetsp:Transcript_54338/g.146537  ORF Transcript_54338/g.146537 Transcript_54338/m.146537 type:complete len:278 (-) Transcript_54338:22-855(-)